MSMVWTLTLITLNSKSKMLEILLEYVNPMFEEKLAKYELPLELKYLAIVESALNPNAISQSGAGGLWQFMYPTGKQFNLEVTSYVDERYDPLQATEAACQYLSSLYNIFGDWSLVLASYNAGPGNVSKAIRRSGGSQNYWNIRKNLPKETQGYVPAFLATMYIYEYHKEHGIRPDRATIKHFATDTIMIKKQMSFAQISDLLDVPVTQLQVMNPSYKLNVIPSYEDQNHFLRLPKDKIAVFASLYTLKKSFACDSSFTTVSASEYASSVFPEIVFKSLEVGSTSFSNDALAVSCCVITS